MINFKQLLTDYGISISTQEEGWIQIQCPYCISPTTGQKKHGGFNLKEKYYNCRKCGWKPLTTILSSLLNTSVRQTKILLKKYKGEIISIDEQEEIVKHPFCLPDYCTEMNYRHRQYLEKRKFNSWELEREWGLLGTNHHGDYKLRVIAPIYLDGKMVSYQGRDITNKSPMRYKACKINTEIIHHKHIVYGFDKLQETRHKDRCIIVEGITGAWRLGAGTVATFGIGFTQQQALFLAKRQIKMSFIMYDPEEKAQEQAELLSHLLSGFGMEVKIIDISKEGFEDPGELSDEKARLISKQLLS